jgi:hypothetical protein
MKMKLYIEMIVTVLTVAGLAGCATSHKKECLAHEIWIYSDAGKVTRHEVWTENHHGGGTAMLADPSATQIASYHTNQAGLGGSSSFSVGSVQATVSTNAAAILSSGGTAVSNVIQGIKQ